MSWGRKLNRKRRNKQRHGLHPDVVSALVEYFKNKTIDYLLGGTATLVLQPPQPSKPIEQTRL